MRPWMWWSGLSRRRRSFATVIAVLFLVVAVVAGVRLTGGAAETPSGLPDQARPGTVLLVPGYGGARDSLLQLADRLRGQGRTADVLTLPGDGTGDLEAQVGTLDAAVRGALAAGAPSVDLVGYSAGGVVVRLWVARDGGAHRARRVVTLGSPLHGTSLAAAGSVFAPGACPVACQQLAPGSALLRELDASPLPAGLPWLSLWTNDDQTVTPPDSARLAGAVNVPLQTVCPGVQVAHGQLPTDSLVTGIVLGALSSATVTAPRPADCGRLVHDGQR